MKCRATIHVVVKIVAKKDVRGKQVWAKMSPAHKSKQEAHRHMHMTCPGSLRDRLWCLRQLIIELYNQFLAVTKGY